jgi:hypothetical protein
MPIRRGFFGGAVYIPTPPTVTIGSVTNFNENRASFNATVNPNGLTTSVKFQYSTNGSTWTDGATLTGLTGTSQSVYSNQTGLSVGTLYYVRAIATNADGSVTSSNTTFTTWSLKTYLNTSAGSYTVSVPSITPTGGSAIAPTIYEMLIYGGGGGANYAGGGGGGYRLAASKVSSATATQNVTGTIGGGGGGGNGGGGTGGAGAGGSSTLVIGDTTYTAGGGGAGAHPGSNGAPNGTGGSVGAGTNPANGGGNNTYGYYYFTGTYVQVVTGYNQMVTGSYEVCDAYDKFGSCTAAHVEYIYGNNPNSPIYGNDTNQPIYAYDGAYYAGGGGGGTDAGGASAITQGSNSHNGGAGGAGGGAYGLRGGNGGGGRGTQSTGANGSVPAGSGPVVGTGGQGWYGAGVAGGVTFKYYGP